MSIHGPDPDDDGPDDPFSISDDAVRAEADTMMARWTEAEDGFRKIGLYLEGHPQIALVPTPPHGAPQPALVVNFAIGKVAFSDRVQNPPKAEVEDEFRKIQITAQDDAFLDERTRIQEALASGKSMDEILLGDDDDGDGS